MTLAERGLGELAGLHGIETCYLSADGVTRRADKEVVLALLGRLGAPVERAGDVAEALRVRKLELARRVVEPVVVIRRGRPGTISVTLPEGVDPRGVKISRAHEADHARPEKLPLRLELFSGIEVEGRRFGHYRAEISQGANGSLKPGYHRLNIELWHEREPQNRPGTGPEAGNWRRRAAYSLAEMSADPRVHTPALISCGAATQYCSIPETS